VVLALLAARERARFRPRDCRAAGGAGAVPDSIAAQLPAWERTIAALAPTYSDARTFLYLGRGVHYAIAREGALKLKESSYLHAEGYPSGELKHGPNALVSPEVPLVVLATVDFDDPESMLRYEKTVSLLYDMREQGARVLALANAGDATIPALASHTHSHRAGGRVAAADLGGRPAAALRLLHGRQPRSRRRPPAQSDQSRDHGIACQEPPVQIVRRLGWMRRGWLWDADGGADLER
jgi:glucosamine 6-phosphate synthetase-like amidotransferase/phosphosugar isomerase protein